MTTASIEHASFEQGQMVLACTPDSAVVVDDANGSAGVDDLLTAVAQGDLDEIRMLLIDACMHQTYSSVGAAVRSDGQWLLILMGTIRCTIRSATSHLTVDARPGEFSQHVFDDVEQVAFYPNQQAALQRDDGTDLLAGAVRASRATLTMAAAESASVMAFPDQADESDSAPLAPTTRFAFDPMTGKPIMDERPDVPVTAARIAPAAAPIQVVADVAEEVAQQQPAPAPAPPVPAAAAPGSGIEVLDLNAAPEPRVALDVGVHGHERQSRAAVEVLGIRCPVDHHNHPDAVYCAQCGRRMGVNHTVVAKPGPRPPLGLLLIDDGSTFSLVSDVIVGRDPSQHPDVIANAADSLRIGGDVAVVSRSHVGVYLDGWSVTAVDLGSSNGTTVRRHSGDAIPLATNVRTMLGAGDTLLIGDREIRLELHHVQT